VDSIEHGSMLDDEAIELLIENDVVRVPVSGLMGRLDPIMQPTRLIAGHRLRPGDRHIDTMTVFAC
jgi:hypothetical protein